MPAVRSLLASCALLLGVLLAMPATSPAVAETQPEASAEPQAQQSPRHAAAVVIDTGTEVRKVCVRFDEPELTGEELLRRAKVEAVFAEYSIGMAVCSLCGVGCPADDCFCESETSDRYWNYSRGAGAGWERSHLGASSTTVTDGDVEGWAWGTDGATPPWIGFEAICFDPPPASPSPSASPASPAAPPAAHTGATSSPTSGPTPASAGTSAPEAAAATSPAKPPDAAADDAPAAPAADDPAAGTVDAADPEAPSEVATASAIAVSQDGGSSGWAGLVAFAGGAVALGGGLFLVRRRLG